MLREATTSTSGVPNTVLQDDFAFRSEHLMAVVGKQLVELYYGKPPVFTYWKGCSTGGRQGAEMAEQFPEEWDGILAGAPAMHWDKFQAYQIWPQMVQMLENGAIIEKSKQDATTAAVRNRKLHSVLI